MLKCKDVAHLASEYIDKNTSHKITLQMRMHLMLCANCRRFIKHLRITQKVTVELATPAEAIDAEAILLKIKQKMADNK